MAADDSDQKRVSPDELRLAPRNKRKKLVGKKEGGVHSVTNENKKKASKQRRRQKTGARENEMVGFGPCGIQQQQQRGERER